ncbi:hypothetical protein B7R54_00245 [Subtercola boreus]|uniref:Uncharacterized protein n=1 Tax=Subtercola boreus TaxID=120213 RepID=A0A3E0VE33_9MICO|nr:hypothetical protein [Subtercola boreus]RFA07813.1 hypothetical protein B7R54_00245 [Subtercola boreus]TQL55340.1 hypothetical protein FB464_2903 [Subtercola boreus]
MHFVDRDPMDAPPPETADAAAARFGVPLMGFARQASLTEFGVSTVGSSSNGGPTSLDSVALSYTVWRNPADPADPVNLADLTDALRESLDAEPIKPLPPWMLELRRLMHYPALWEGTLTTRMPAAAGQTPEAVLVAHANHILTNTFRDERVVGAFPGQLDSPVEQRHIRPTSVRIDGVDVPGLGIDTDPHVYAVGADLGDRMLTAVVARDHLPYVTLAFETRRPRDAA